ncbi:MAG: MauE/DoxX family redox-associated membrane protein [Candidatus Tumulicola sp.]
MQLGRRTKGAVNAAVFAFRLFVGGLLIAAGGLKIGHSAALAASIASFRLLPPGVIAPLALGLPFLEVMLGVYLVAGLFTRIAAAVAALQFLTYAAAVAWATVRHIPAGCGCFGPNDTAVADWPHVAFDLALALASAFIAFGAPGALAVDRRFRSS